MKKHSVQTLPWWKIGMTIVPGVWLLFVQYTSMKWEQGGFVFIITIVMATVFIMGSLLKERHIASWCWPIFGMLLWTGWHVIDWILYSRTTAIIMNDIRDVINIGLNPHTRNVIGYIIVITFLMIGVYGTYWVYQQFKGQMPQLGWMLCVLLLMLVVTYVLYINSRMKPEDCFGVWFISSHLSCQLQGVLGVWGTAWVALLLLLTPIGVALRWAKKYGLMASLFVVVFEPAWTEILFNPIQSLGIQYFRLRPDKTLVAPIEITIDILTFLPILIFFIIIPLGLSFSQSIKAQRVWLTVPSLITLVVIYLLRGLVLNDTGFEYLLVDWIVFILIAIHFWLPLLITAILYANDSLKTREKSHLPKNRPNNPLAHELESSAVIEGYKPDK